MAMQENADQDIGRAQPDELGQHDSQREEPRGVEEGQVTPLAKTVDGDFR